MAKTHPPLSEADIFHIVIGTAGHIDHGKSALVQALTGVNPDRLKEERERGMTIDLGFAPLVLQDGRRVGIIDVPGHERFVKNMVAGATGIDAVLLVVAADDGVMPQTREHMDIMGLLGVRRGLVAITKCDVVDEELRELVVDDVQRYLHGSFLEDAPIICTSVVSGEGMDDLRGAVDRLLADLPERSADGIFRMPIQRVFSAKGHGTIVTGVPISGRAAIGDTLEIQPGGARGRVRAVQAYHRSATAARAGHSSALNLSDVDYKEVRRGQVVTTPDTLRAERNIEARLICLPSLRKPLRHLAQVRFHSGTSEELGRLAILESGGLGAGQSAYVQIRLENPVVVAPGDRFVLRLHSPMVTVGGGEVIGTSKWRLKSGKDYVIGRLRDKEKAVGRADETVASLVKEAGSAGISGNDLRRASLLPPEEFRGRIETLKETGEIVELTKPLRYLHGDALAEVQERILAALVEFHSQEPLRMRMPRSGLEQRAAADRQPIDLALARLLEDGRVMAEGSKGIRLREHQVRLTPRQEEMSRRLLDLYLADRYSTPRRGELAERLEVEEEELLPVLVLLLEREDLIDLGDGVVLHQEAIREAGRLALQEIEKEGELTVVRFKDILGSTRKYVVPLLEHLDTQGVTVRDGNRRVAATGGAAAGGV